MGGNYGLGLRAEAGEDTRRVWLVHQVIPMACDVS